MPRVLRNLGPPNSGENGKQRVVIIPDDSEFVPFYKPSDGEDEEETTDEFIITPLEVVISPQELAQAQADEILQAARLQAEQMTAAAKKDADNLRAQAGQEGHDEAFAFYSEKIGQMLSQAENTIIKIENAQDSFLEELQASTGRLAVEIAATILKHELVIDPLALCDMAEDAMTSVKDVKWAVLSLSKELVPLVELLRSELPEKCPTVATLDVTGKAIPIGSCVIDSPQGIVDASIKTQLDNLLHRFEQIEQNKRKSNQNKK